MLLWCDLTILTPRTCGNTIRFHQHSIQWDTGCHMLYRFIEGQRRTDGKPAAQINILLQPCITGIPVHQIPVFIVTQIFKCFLFSSLQMQNHRFLISLCKSKLLLKQPGLQRHIRVTPDRIQSDFTDDVHFLKNRQHCIPVNLIHLPWMNTGTDP